MPIDTLAGVPMDMEGGQFIGLVAVGGFFLAWIVSTIARSARKTVVSREREQTRREIAAYVAEGSMTPEQAERLLIAGLGANQSEDSCCMGRSA